MSSDRMSESPEPEVTPIVRVYLEDNDMYGSLTSLDLLLSRPMNSVHLVNTQRSEAFNIPKLLRPSQETGFANIIS
jgi:hypothetical protein